MLLSVLVYVCYFMPVIECQRYADRARHQLHSLENRGRGTDVEIQLELSAAEAARGGKKEVRVPGRAEKLGLMFPAGLKNGERLQFRGDGNPGINGTSSGDLYVQVVAR
jgi:DnaJ-class molecular chaperone